MPPDRPAHGNQGCTDDAPREVCSCTINQRPLPSGANTSVYAPSTSRSGKRCSKVPDAMANRLSAPSCSSIVLMWNRPIVCGSGNFLYVALHLLLDLEKEVISFAARHGIGLLPQVRPTQLAGIEINAYAQELASVVIWIGYLQWMHHNGFNPPSHPVLEPIESIRRMDAILDLSDPEKPKEPEWPEAETALMRAVLEDAIL